MSPLNYDTHKNQPKILKLLYARKKVNTDTVLNYKRPPVFITGTWAACSNDKLPSLIGYFARKGAGIDSCGFLIKDYLTSRKVSGSRPDEVNEFFTASVV
jgi:hypothetical protein